MARIRTVKPDIWTDEKLVECSIAARLLFIGLFNFADDNGNLPRSAKKIKMQVFPADELNCEPLLQELIQWDLIREYAVGEDQYLHIKGFKKHQVINKPSKSGIPQPPFSECSGSDTDEIHPDSNTTTGALPEDCGSAPVALLHGKEGKGREGKGETQDRAGGELFTPNPAQEKTPPPPPDLPDHDSRTRSPVIIGGIAKYQTLISDDWEPRPDTVELLMSGLHAIPKQFIDEQIHEFRIFWRDRNTPQTSWDAKFIQRCGSEWKRNGHQWSPSPGGKIHAISKSGNRQPFAERIREQARRVIEGCDAEDGEAGGLAVGPV